MSSVLFSPDDEQRVRKRIEEALRIHDESTSREKVSPWVAYYFSDCAPLLAELARVRGELAAQQRGAGGVEAVMVKK